MKSITALVIFSDSNYYFFSTRQYPKPAKWIWYPGDFEVWLHTIVGGRRQERGQPYPPFWRMDSHYGVVIFMKKYNNANQEKIQVYADGKYQIRLDGEIMYILIHLIFSFLKVYILLRSWLKTTKRTRLAHNR